MRFITITSFIYFIFLSNNIISQENINYETFPEWAYSTVAVNEESYSFSFLVPTQLETTGYEYYLINRFDSFGNTNQFGEFYISLSYEVKYGNHSIYFNLPKEVMETLVLVIVEKRGEKEDINHRIKLKNINMKTNIKNKKEFQDFLNSDLFTNSPFSRLNNDSLAFFKAQLKFDEDGFPQGYWGDLVKSENLTDSEVGDLVSSIFGFNKDKFLLGYNKKLSVSGNCMPYKNWSCAK